MQLKSCRPLFAAKKSLVLLRELQVSVSANTSVKVADARTSKVYLGTVTEIALRAVDVLRKTTIKIHLLFQIKEIKREEEKMEKRLLIATWMAMKVSTKNLQFQR